MMKPNKTVLTVLIAVIAMAAAGAIFYFAGRTAPLAMAEVQVKTGDISEKINLSGQVKASQGVDLAFEGQGRIVANYVKVGDRVYTGQALAATDSSVLQAQLAQAKAQLDGQSMDLAKNKADTSLKSAYASALAAAQKSVTVAKNTLLVAADIQFAHFNAATQQNFGFSSAKGVAAGILLGASDAGNWTSQSLAALNGGAFGKVQAVISNPTNENIDSALPGVLSALESVRDVLNAIPNDSSVLTATEKASIVAEKANINGEIISITNATQAIANQKVGNDASLLATNSQIEGASASIQAIRSQIAKTVIRAMFNGKVDKNDVVVGSIATPNMPVITISNDNLEINTTVPEIYINDVKPQAKAQVTLDAFGANTVFPATVVSVDTAPSVVDGVQVYKARLKFDGTDPKITPGMTANITIDLGTHQNAVVAPRLGVTQNNGKYFVMVKKESGGLEAREVTIGLKNGTSVEIISGLQAGEKILSY